MGQKRVQEYGVEIPMAGKSLRYSGLYCTRVFSAHLGDCGYISPSAVSVSLFEEKTREGFLHLPNGCQKRLSEDLSAPRKEELLDASCSQGP